MCFLFLQMHQTIEIQNIDYSRIRELMTTSYAIFHRIQIEAQVPSVQRSCAARSRAQTLVTVTKHNL